MVGEGKPSSLHMAKALSFRARLDASASKPSVHVVKRDDRRASGGPGVRTRGPDEAWTRGEICVRHGWRIRWRIFEYWE
jgi:hypothetical protein